MKPSLLEWNIYITRYQAWFPNSLPLLGWAWRSEVVEDGIGGDISSVPSQCPPLHFLSAHLLFSYPSQFPFLSFNPCLTSPPPWFSTVPRDILNKKWWLFVFQNSGPILFKQYSVLCNAPSHLYEIIILEKYWRVTYIGFKNMQTCWTWMLRYY